MALSFLEDINNSSEIKEWNEEEFQSIQSQLKLFLPLEIYRYEKQKDEYLQQNYYQLITATSTYINMKFTEMNIQFDYLVIDQSSSMIELELGLIIMHFGISSLKGIILIGNENESPILIFNKEMSQYTHLEKSLFARLYSLQQNELNKLN